MIRRFRGLALLALAALPALAQTTFPLLIQVRVGDNISTVANNASVGVGAEDIGRPLRIQVNTRNRTSQPLTIATGADLLGAGDFSLVSAPAAATVLQPGETAASEVLFTPRSSRVVSAQLSFVVSEPGSDGRPLFSIFNLNFTGTAPEVVLAYILPTNGNLVSLADGGAIDFPNTPVGTNLLATVSIFNRGSGVGNVRTLTLSGADFELIGAPLLPGAVDTGREVRFGVRYTPKQNGPSRGSLTMGLDSRTITVSLVGNGTGPQLIYEGLFEDRTATVEEGGTLTIPETKIGETRSFSFRVRNTGTADTVVSSLSLTGAGYQLSDLLPLPQPLVQGGSFTFTVNLTPATPGAARGRLRINNAQFDLVSQAVGPRLVYAYTVAGVSVTLQPNGSVLFSATPIGQSREAVFRVENTGTAASSLASIALTDLRAGFELINLPALPLTIEPGASVTFGIRYSPDTVSLTSAGLRVDTVPFTISGNGAPAVPLPSYRFEGASGNVEPLSQPALSLRLDSAYPVAIVGNVVLTLEPLSGLSPDGSVVLSNGSRSIDFTIPAGSTTAQFPNGDTLLRLQTGSVAGDIVLTPSFNTRGGFALTPASPPVARLRVPLAAPRLLTVNTSEGTNSLLVTLTGFATGRNLRNVIVEFRPRTGFQLAAARLTIPAGDPAGAWFRNPASQPFGGQFVLALPLTFRSDVTGINALDAIESMTVTVDNDSGASNTLTVQR